MDGCPGDDARKAADEGLLIIAPLVWSVKCTCIRCGDRRGIGMMSAAISMMAGVEQTKVSLVSGDLFSGQGGQDDVSFAKNFNESVGVPASSQGKNAADELTIAFAGLKRTTPTKKLEEVAEKP